MFVCKPPEKVQVEDDKNNKVCCTFCDKKVCEKYLKRHQGSGACRRKARSKNHKCILCDNKATHGYWNAITGEFVPKWCYLHLISYKEHLHTKTWIRQRSMYFLKHKIPQHFHCPPIKRISNTLAGLILVKIFISYHQMEIMEPPWYFRIMFALYKNTYKPTIKCTICGEITKNTHINSLLNFNRGCHCTKNVLCSSQNKWEQFMRMCKDDKRGIKCLIPTYEDWGKKDITNRSLIPMKHVGTDLIPGCGEEVFVCFHEYFGSGYFGCSCYNTKKKLVQNRRNEFVQRGLNHPKKPMDILTTERQWKTTMINAHCKPLVRCRTCNIESDKSTIASLFMLGCGFDCDCTQWKTENMMRKLVSQIIPNLTFKHIRPDFLRNETGKDRRNNLELDFFCQEIKLAFEFNGRQHYVFTPFFHRTHDTFLEQKRKDELKVCLCENHGIYLISCPWNGFDGDPTKKERKNETKLSLETNMKAYLKFRIKQWVYDTGYTGEIKI